MLFKLKYKNPQKKFISAFSKNDKIILDHFQILDITIYKEDNIWNINLLQYRNIIPEFKIRIILTF